MVLFRITIGSLWVSILLIDGGLWTPTELTPPAISIASEPGTTRPGLIWMSLRAA